MEEGQWQSYNILYTQYYKMTQMFLDCILLLYFAPNSKITSNEFIKHDD